MFNTQDDDPDSTSPRRSFRTSDLCMALDASTQSLTTVYMISNSSIRGWDIHGHNLAS